MSCHEEIPGILAIRTGTRARERTCHTSPHRTCIFMALLCVAAAYPAVSQTEPDKPNITTFIDHFSQFPQLPRLLADHGYVSLHTGKFWQGNPLTVSGFTDTLDEDQHRHGSPKSLQIGREGIQPIYDFIANARAEEKPFLVWYAPFLPHTPHTPPERLLEKNEGRKYHAMVEWLDESCGELLDYQGVDQESGRDVMTKREGERAGRDIILPGDGGSRFAGTTRTQSS
jgi:hypothetical protein